MTAVGDVSSLIGSIGGLFPKNTDTSGNSTLDANTNSDTANVAGSILKGATDTSQSQVSDTSTTQNQTTAQKTAQSTTGTQSTTASASDAALKAITSNIGLAQSNATDSSKTTDLVSNILTQAAMTFAPTKTLATAAGVYNSPTLSMLSSFAQGSATAQSANAVLSYETAQQGLAEGASSDLAKATATTVAANSSTGDSTSTQVSQLLSSVMQSLFGNTAQNTSQNLLTANQGTSTGHQDQTTTSSQQGSSGISIVCTELMKQGKLDKKLWVENSRKFQKYSKLSKDSYYFWARPAVKYLQEHSDSKLSRALGSVMLARCNGKWYGIAVVNIVTFFSGLIMLASQSSSDYPALEF